MKSLPINLRLPRYALSDSLIEQHQKPVFRAVEVYVDL